MKICPRCHKTYTDENLNFCLDDGSVLEQAAGGTLPETVMLNQPRITVPVQQTSGQQIPNQYGQPPAWNTGQPQYANHPKKSSKMWIWVLLILGAVALVCGGGLVGLIYIGSQVDTTSNKTTNLKTTPTATSNSKSNSSANSSTATERTDINKLDLSKWKQTDQSYGTTDYSDGELIMSSKKAGFYYVLAGTKDQMTGNANTLVTVRNVNGASTTLGYGLVFHSNPKPLQQGYAFLLDTSSQKYRVVHHSPGKEDAVVAWTRSDAIRSGSEENTLEVRDRSDKVELYINGKLVNSIRNVYGYPNGVLGLYTGDAIKVAFKDLEIHK